MGADTVEGRAGFGVAEAAGVDTGGDESDGLAVDLGAAVPRPSYEIVGDRECRRRRIAEVEGSVR